MKQQREWELLNTKPFLKTQVTCQTCVALCWSCWEELHRMNETHFQTAGLTDFDTADAGWQQQRLIFWWPQLLKLVMVCRIPSDTLTLPDTKMKKSLQKYEYGIYARLPKFQIPCWVCKLTYHVKTLKKFNHQHKNVF